MSPSEIEQAALQLHIKERLRLARLLIESISDAEVEQSGIEEGIRRIEDLVTGKVVGISHVEFLRRLKAE